MCNYIPKQPLCNLIVPGLCDNTQFGYLFIEYIDLLFALGWWAQVAVAGLDSWFVLIITLDRFGSVIAHSWTLFKKGAAATCILWMVCLRGLLSGRPVPTSVVVTLIIHTAVSILCVWYWQCNALGDQVPLSDQINVGYVIYYACNSSLSLHMQSLWVDIDTHGHTEREGVAPFPTYHVYCLFSWLVNSCVCVCV